MRKLASILLLAILLFNWVGFRIISALLEARSNAALIVNLDRDQYQQDELISVKIPSSLPYYVGSGQFERVDGEIELNNIHYNYVKRRVVQDSIEYLCIPNRAKTALKQASNEYYKLMNDIKQDNQSKKHSADFAKVALQDYDYSSQDFNCSAHYLRLSTHPSYQKDHYLSLKLVPFELPPNC